MMTRKKAIIWILSVVIIVITCGLSWVFIYRRRKLKDPFIYKDLISEISETIIPKTDTPGAKDANLSTSIVNVIKSCLPVSEKRTIITGLDSIETYAQKTYFTSFAQCTNDEKITILRYFENTRHFQNVFLDKIRQRVFGRSFFELIKEVTVAAYCGSQLGATRGLVYDHVPGNYIACMPLLHGQRSWATS